MKKVKFLVSTLAVVGMITYTSVSTANSTSNQEKSVITRVQDVCYRVSVCRITSTGSTGSIKNLSFYGEYDPDSGYIKIYDKSGNLVSSGYPSGSDRSGYSHHVGIYYFNL